MKTFFTLIIISLLFFSCQKDGLDENPLTACIGEVQISDNVVECNTALDASDLLTYCVPIEAGSYQLTDSSKLFLPQYCIEEGGEINFKNANNDTITFTVEIKEFLKGTFTIGTPYGCATNPSKRTAVCIETEYINLLLSAPSFDLLLRLSTRHELDFLDIDGVSDYLSISRREQTTWKTELFAIVEQRTGSDNQTDNQRNYSRLDVGTGTFTDVITNNIGINNSFDYFVNPVLGLFAFRDENNTLWTLAD